MKSHKFQKDKFIFSIIGYSMVWLAAIISVLPFIMVISGSFTEESAIFKYGYRLIPSQFSLKAYNMVFDRPGRMLAAYGVSIGITVVGTAIGLFFTAMTGYVLNKKELRTRNFFSLYFYFTTLFSGGLVPWYILIAKYLNLRDNYLALILPLLFSVFFIIIMRTFMQSIPDAITESAKIDGAGEFYIFVNIILPLSKPALATIGMFTALRYWNNWQNAMLFLHKESMFPLQYFLYRLLSSIEFLKQAATAGVNTAVELPSESFKLAMTIVATGPIIFLFPVLQKYFIKGMTIGAVKG